MTPSEDQIRRVNSPDSPTSFHAAVEVVGAHYARSRGDRLIIDDPHGEMSDGDREALRQTFLDAAERTGLDFPGVVVLSRTAPAPSPDMIDLNFDGLNRWNETVLHGERYNGLLRVEDYKPRPSDGPDTRQQRRYRARKGQA